MKKDRGRIYLILAFFVLLIVGIGLALAQSGLEKLLNSSGSEAYKDEKRDLYNNYGLTDNQSLSTTKILETDSLVIYTDRLFRVNQASKTNASYTANVAKALSKKTDADILIMPAPERGVFETGYESEKTQYNDYVTALEKAVGNSATVVNPLSALEKHDDEYIYFRCESCWTMRGAFYASQCINDALGYKEEDLDDYSEYAFGDFNGNLRASAKSDYKSEAVAEDISNIPIDPFYIYLKESNPNREALTYEDDDDKLKTTKRPTILLNDGGPGSVVGDNYEYSVVEGSGEDNILLIADMSGKMMIPYLSETFGKVYVSNILKDDSLLDNLDTIVDNYDIKHIVYVQSVAQMGNSSYMKALNSLVKKGDDE